MEVTAAVLDEVSADMPSVIDATARAGEGSFASEYHGVQEDPVTAVENGLTLQDELIEYLTFPVRNGPCDTDNAADGASPRKEVQVAIYQHPPSGVGGAVYNGGTHLSSRFRLPTARQHSELTSSNLQPRIFVPICALDKLT